ncbi:MAG: hypothetical protein PVH30_10355 [Desulfobacterales bacterium]|jgi:hypothetical protein
MATESNDIRQHPSPPIHVAADMTIEAGGMKVQVTASGTSIVLHSNSLTDLFKVARWRRERIAHLIAAVGSLDRFLDRIDLTLCLYHHRMPVAGKGLNPFLRSRLKQVWAFLERTGRKVE